MKILIAEDDSVSRAVLQTTLTRWGHEVLATTDGRAAWEVLQREDAPALAILDWMMPELDGPEVCRRVRQLGRQEPTYLILLTARCQKEDIVAGLESGADDYITKPFDRSELRARLDVGRRIIQLQRDLADRVRELQKALERVEQLQGLLPMCAWCRKVRDGQDYWQRVEDYLASYSRVQITHGICPACVAQLNAEMPWLSCNGR